jgi:hypothetical protein
MHIYHRQDSDSTRFAIYLDGVRTFFGFPAAQLKASKVYFRELEDLFSDIEAKHPSNSPLEDASWHTIRKLEKSNKRVHQKLMRTGLVDQKKAASLGLKDAFESYIDLKASEEWEPRTVNNWHQTKARVLQGFEPDIQISAITRVAMAKHFGDLRKKYGENTLVKDVKNVKQLWRHFFTEKAIPVNAMWNLTFKRKRSLQATNSGKEFVDPVPFQKALDVITPLQQKTLLAYYRWMGARQNDAKGDNWEDVNWSKKAINRFDCKRKTKLGWCPIPHQLFPLLKSWHEQVIAEKGKAEGPLFPWMRQSAPAAQRSFFISRLKKNGIPLWQKFFNSLRSSRSIEVRRLPNGRFLEAKWIGHSADVADSHYDAVIDTDFDAITNPPMASPGQDDDQRQDDAEAA